jgi:predicted nucleic acid-binding protein
MPSYLDSSALIKRYVREPGSPVVARLFTVGETLIVSAIAWAECLAALSRKRHDGTLSPRSHAQASTAFAAEWRALHEIAVTVEIHAIVRELLDRTPLRGMDAIHLASARWVERQLGSALSFYCSDRKLSAAARAVGLIVVDPAAG